MHTHAPAPSQLSSVPHGVPSGCDPVAPQTGPAVHESAPSWQTLPAGVQAAPAVHGTQAPPLQTWSVPQTVPSVRGPASVQTGVPVVHETTPEWQGIPGSQAAPVVHATQAPAALQT